MFFRGHVFLGLPLPPPPPMMIRVILSRENAWRIFSTMVIFVLMSVKPEPHVRIFAFSLSKVFPTLESENVLLLHQKMSETSQQMRETADESTKKEKRERFYLVHAITTSRRYHMLHQSSTLSSTCHLHPIDTLHSTNSCAGVHLFLITQGELN